MWISIPTEQTTAWTDLILTLLALACLIAMKEIAKPKPIWTSAWRGVFGLLALASFLGALAHGIQWTPQILSTFGFASTAVYRSPWRWWRSPRLPASGVTALPENSFQGPSSMPCSSSRSLRLGPTPFFFSSSTKGLYCWQLSGCSARFFLSWDSRDGTSCVGYCVKPCRGLSRYEDGLRRFRLIVSAAGREPSGIHLRLSTYPLLEEPDGLRRFRIIVSAAGREPSGFHLRLSTYSLLEEPDGLRRFRYQCSRQGASRLASKGVQRVHARSFADIMVLKVPNSQTKRVARNAFSSLTPTFFDRVAPLLDRQ